MLSINPNPTLIHRAPDVRTGLKSTLVVRTHASLASGWRAPGGGGWGWEEVGELLQSAGTLPHPAFQAPDVRSHP